MNLLKDTKVIEYMSLMDSISFDQFMNLNCDCFDADSPGDSHAGTKTSFSTNLAELAANQESKSISLTALYITNATYFNGETMAFLLNCMLESQDVVMVEGYRSILDKNFKAHPPCAHYMNVEYETLMLTPFKRYFKEMGFWDYLVSTFNQITDGTILYGENKASDLAFRRALDFCICILRINFEKSKINNCRPLIMTCLKYNPERKTRLSEINKLLDMLFNTGYNFQVQIVNLAILIHQMMN